MELPVAQGDPSKPPPDPEPEVPSFRDELAPVLQSTCAFSGCHGPGPPAPQMGMLLTQEAAYGNLVNVPSVEVPALMRVQPGDPDASYLIQKLEGTAAVGSRMPLIGPPLAPEVILAFRQWIAASAPDN